MHCTKIEQSITIVAERVTGQNEEEEVIEELLAIESEKEELDELDNDEWDEDCISHGLMIRNYNQV